MGRGALLLVTLSGCSLLVDGSKYSGGRADAGPADTGDAFIPGCGNGVVEAGEECEDGNDVAGDGCSARCALEPAVGGPGCGAPVPIPLPWTGTSYFNRATGTTGTGPSAIDPHRCDNPVPPDPGAQEHVFTVQLPAPGELSASVSPLDPPWDVVLYVRQSCAVDEDELECADDGPQGESEVISLVLPAGRYFIVVDGYEPGVSGSYELHVTFTPASD